MSPDALAVRPDLAPVPVDEQKAVAYALAARSDATRRAYASDWAAFLAWCGGKGYPSLPADPRHVAGYIAEAAETLKPSTIGRRLASISVAHKSAGLPSPIGLEPVPATMAGIRRTLGTAPDKKAPVRVSHLRGAMVAFPCDLRGKRDRALILVGYAGGFRRSELVALDVADVSFVPEGAVILVRRSKGDQEGKGFKKALHHGKNADTCPVAALKGWLRAAGVSSGPVFRKVEKNEAVSPRRLSARTVALVVQDRARLLGLDPDAIGAHSLRSGLVTDAYASGAAESDIMRQTGHRSRTVLEGYRQEADLFRGNVSDRVGL